LDRAAARWRSEEDAAIRAGVEAGKSWREIAEGLPGRTFFATKRHGMKLGMKHHGGWTAEEDATLRAGVEAGAPWETIAEKLPNRTVQASRYRARQLGIERSEKKVFVAWTEAEDEEIRAGVAAGERNAEIAERLPGRTMGAVEGRRTRLLKGERTLDALRDSLREQGESVREFWTEAEDAALREGFASGKSWKEVAKDFPRRTQPAVETRARKRLLLKRDDSDSAV
jgi:sugar phosphate isomerase/epimerase